MQDVQEELKLAKEELEGSRAVGPRSGEMTDLRLARLRLGMGHLISAVELLAARETLRVQEASEHAGTLAEHERAVATGFQSVGAYRRWKNDLVRTVEREQGKHTTPGPHAGRGWYIPALDDDSWYADTSRSHRRLLTSITFSKVAGDLEVLAPGFTVFKTATDQAWKQGRLWVWGQIQQ